MKAEVKFTKDHKGNKKGEVKALDLVIASRLVLESRTAVYVDEEKQAIAKSRIKDADDKAKKAEEARKALEESKKQRK